MKVAEAFVEIEARFDKLKQGLDKAVRSTRETAGKIESRFKRMRDGVSNAFDRMAKAAGLSLQRIGVAVAGLATGLALLVNRIAQTIDAQAKLARTVGTTTQEIRALQFAADRSGVSQEKLNTALLAFTKRIGEAASGTGDAVAAFQRLGLDPAQLAMLDLADAIDLVADALDRIPTAAERADIASRLFSRGGVELTRVLAGGSREVEKLRAEFEKLNGTISEAEAKRIEDYNDAVTNLGASWGRVWKDITIATSGPLQSVADFMVIWIDRIRETDLSLKGLAKTYKTFASEMPLGMILGIEPDTNLSADTRGAEDTRSAAARARIAAANQLATDLPPAAMAEAMREFQRELAFTSQYTGLPGPAFLRPRGYGEFSTGGRGDQPRQMPSMFPRSGPMDKPIAAAVTAAVQQVVQATTQTIGTVNTAIGGFTTGTDRQIQQNMLQQQQQQTRLLTTLIAVARGAATSFI